MQASNNKKKSLNRNVEFGSKKIKFKEVVVVSIIMLIAILIILRIMN
jgi:uncharacterized membrane protein YvbJ